MSQPKQPPSGPPREFDINGHKVLVDAEDYPLLSRYAWYVKKDKNNFYVYAPIKLMGKPTAVSMHRLITGMRDCQIDHRNRNGLDNRKENLRYANNKQNSFNRVRKNSLGYRGVYKPKNSSLYAAQIQIEGKKYQSKGFKTPEEAARAYDQLSKEHHGEFGIRNFKD